MPGNFLEKQSLKFKLDVFEGPLDLLLHLIKQSEVDIYQISMMNIIDQYLIYMKMMEQLDLELSGDFILMAATLLQIKSRMLLPVEERSNSEDNEEDFDPCSELIRQLVEYKKFKEVAGQLEERELLWSNIYNRPNEIVFAPQASLLDMSSIHLQDLVKIFEDVLTRQEKNLRFISHEEVRLEDKIEMIKETLNFSNRVRFRELFMNSTSRVEIVVIFLAILELMKQQDILVEQDDNFSDIYIVKKQKDLTMVAGQ